MNKTPLASSLTYQTNPSGSHGDLVLQSREFSVGGKPGSSSATDQGQRGACFSIATSAESSPKIKDSSSIQLCRQSASQVDRSGRQGDLSEVLQGVDEPTSLSLSLRLRHDRFPRVSPGFRQTECASQRWDRFSRSRLVSCERLCGLQSSRAVRVALRASGSWR